MTTISVTIEIDDQMLQSYTDTHLATLWHVAQANPAPHADRQAGEIAERIGREIICRWLKATAPEIWKHQGRDYYWKHLASFARYVPGGSGRAFDPEWHEGTWVLKDDAPRPEAAAAEGCQP